MSTPPHNLAADPLTSPYTDQASVPQPRPTQNNEEEEGRQQQQQEKGTSGVIPTGCTTTTTATSPRLLKSHSYPPMAHRSSSDHPGRGIHFPTPHRFRRHPSPPSDTSPSALSRLLRTFDESLRDRLRSLHPVPAAAPSLSYLSRAVEVLRSTHADAAKVISDPSLRGAADPAVSAYLDSSTGLLDSCNAVSARIDRLLRSRLFLALAVHHILLSDGPEAERVQKARRALADWEQETDAAADEDPAGEAPEWTSRTCGGLIKGISFPRDPPSPGKSSVTARAVYAVEAVSALVGGMLLGSLFGAKSVRIGTVPAEFGWADIYNDIRKAFCSGSVTSCQPAEVTAVESRARELARVLEDVNIRPAAEYLEEELERMTEGLDALAASVNGLFRAAMGARNAAVEGLRLGRKNCK